QGGDSAQAGEDVAAGAHVGVQDGEQPGDVAAPGGGQERLHRPVAVAGDDAGLGCGGAADAAAGAAGELAGGGGGALHDGGDVVEGHGEHVVQDEREAFGGGEGVQDHQQGG